MQKRPKRRVMAAGEGEGVPPPLCDPLFNPLKDTSAHTHMHAHTFCPGVTDGRMLAEANSELPPFSLLSPSLQRTAGRQTFLLLSFQRKTKECVGPLLHTRAHTHIQTQTPPLKKTVNATVG